LTSFDECGFAPSQPVSYTWVRRGERKRIPYENPQGRRVNALVALDTDGPAPGLYWATKPKALCAEEFVRFLHALPPVPVPRVVVLDNASIHRSAVVKAALPGLWQQRIYLYYLPPYSPDRGDIERVFREVKHYDLPERRYGTVPALTTAVHDAFARYESRLLAKYQHQPRRPA
jgi:transposase